MIRLYITGKAGTKDISKMIKNVTWSGEYQKCARSLSFDLMASPIDKSIPVIEIDNGCAVTFLQDDILLFDGFVFSYQKSTSGSTISCECFDRGIYLNRNKTSLKVRSLTPEQVVSLLAKDFGFQLGDVASTGHKFNRNFLGVALYEIMQTAYTLAAASTGKKYQILFDGAKLCVREKSLSDRTLIIQGASNLMEATTSVSVKSMVNRVAVYNKEDNLVRVVDNPEYIKLYGLMQEYIKDPKDQSSVQKILDDNGVQQKMTVQNLGNIANVTGGTAVVREPYTGTYGLFYVDSDVHTWKNGLYTNKLTLNFQNIMDSKTAGALPNKTGSQTGENWEYLNPYTPGQTTIKQEAASGGGSSFYVNPQGG